MQVGTVNDNKNTSSTRELREKAGIWLRTRRENLGLSQRVLADRVNMEYYTFISQIESPSKGRVPADRLRQWAEAGGGPERICIDFNAVL